MEATIQLLDKGNIKQVISSDLYALPELYQSVSPTTSELYINDLIPHDYDENWEPDAMKNLRSLYEEFSQKKNCYFICKVEFVILNKIFTRTIRIIEALEALNIGGINKIDVRNYLLKNEFCCEDETTTEKLKSLANVAGMIRGILN